MASSHEDSHRFHWHYAELDDKNFQVHGRSLLFIIILFSLLLLLTFLCLYARWLYRFHRRSSSLPTFMATTTTTTTDMNPPPGGLPPLGLDPATINSFPIILYRSSTDPNSDETQSCSICLSTLQDEEKVKVLPNCNHCYHPECVDKWLSTQSSCPLCRASLRVNSSADSTLP
ncbi:zinc finger protein [Macleaya cordata]|uniref:RING-type E3 ubiquitin transferase n=1 Tax=Macleaya cordata TaxID=56857 RepID=A0A200PLN9_MACCD|nr:zinc finger protein [Macleaya cordata]